MNQLRTVFGTATLLGLSVIIGTVVCILAPFDRKARLWWPAAQFWAWGLLKACGMQRLSVRGAEHIGASPGAIVMCNHESHMDPPAMMALSPEPTRFLAKHVLFYFPVFGWGMWSAGMVPINRSNRAKAFKSLERAAARIRAGKMVLIFPEGTRAPGPQKELLPFKKGGFVMAVHGGAPIIPVGIAGSRDILPKGWNWVRPADIAVVVGEPIDTTGFTEDTKEELMALVQKRIEALREQAHALRDAQPAA